MYKRAGFKTSRAFGRFFRDQGKRMFSEEMISIFAEVLTTWQVIVAAVVVLLYIFLVNYVSRLSRRPSFSMRPGKVKKKKKEAPAAAEDLEKTENDELGLEEE
jgi:flagellar biosynthesis/type III secretory pathway M-ring protein FliF/YscJ